jgi:hypothetical protein
MCVLICANSNLREWLGAPSTLAYRQALHLCPVFGSVVASEAAYQGQSIRSDLVDNHKIDQAAQRFSTKRTAWILVYCRYRDQSLHCSIQPVEPRGLSRDWQKALEAIAKTWGRLLSLVGLGW